jgi:hypothetical protein
MATRMTSSPLQAGVCANRRLSVGILGDSTSLTNLTSHPNHTGSSADLVCFLHGGVGLVGGGQNGASDLSLGTGQKAAPGCDSNDCLGWTLKVRIEQGLAGLCPEDFSTPSSHSPGQMSLFWSSDAKSKCTEDRIEVKVRLVASPTFPRLFPFGELGTFPLATHFSKFCPHPAACTGPGQCVGDPACAPPLPHTHSSPRTTGAPNVLEIKGPFQCQHILKMHRRVWCLLIEKRVSKRCSKFPAL